MKDIFEIASETEILMESWFGTACCKVIPYNKLIYSLPIFIFY